MGLTKYQLTEEYKRTQIKEENEETDLATSSNHIRIINHHSRNNDIDHHKDKEEDDDADDEAYDEADDEEHDEEDDEEDDDEDDDA